MNKLTSFKPLLNRVMIKRVLVKQKSAAGLILSNNNQSQRYGLVISVGPGLTNNKTGNSIPLQVKVGEYVLLPEYNGTKVDMEDSDKDVDYMVYKDTELLGALEGVKML